MSSLTGCYGRFRDQLPHHPLTLADWVLVGKDLVGEREKQAA